METIFLKKEASVILNDDITVTVLGIDGDEVTLAIDFPQWMESGGNECGDDIEVACPS